MKKNTSITKSALLHPSSCPFFLFPTCHVPMNSNIFSKYHFVWSIGLVSSGNWIHIVVMQIIHKNLMICLIPKNIKEKKIFIFDFTLKNYI